MFGGEETRPFSWKTAKGLGYYYYYYYYYYHEITTIFADPDPTRICIILLVPDPFQSNPRRNRSTSCGLVEPFRCIHRLETPYKYGQRRTKPCDLSKVETGSGTRSGIRISQKIYRVPDTPGSLFNFFQQYTSQDISMSLEGKSQNSAVQNLCIMTRKKNRPTVGTGADR